MPPLRACSQLLTPKMEYPKPKLGMEVGVSGVHSWLQSESEASTDTWQDPGLQGLTAKVTKPQTKVTKLRFVAKF